MNNDQLRAMYNGFGTLNRPQKYGDDLYNDRENMMPSAGQELTQTGTDEAGNEVGLDAAEDADAVPVLLGEGADVGHVGRHGVRLERPGIGERQKGMRGETKRGEALFEGGADHVLGRILPVAPGRMRMIVCLHADIVAQFRRHLWYNMRRFCKEKSQHVR